MSDASPNQTAPQGKFARSLQNHMEAWCERSGQHPTSWAKWTYGTYPPGPDSRGNRRKDVCQSARLFFHDPSTCYLRRPWHKNRNRRCWEIFAASQGSVRNAFPGAALDGSCPFIHDAQQPMRNLAIAYGLEQEGLVAKAWFALCRHDDNPDVAAHWDAWQTMLADRATAPCLPASTVVRAGLEDGHEDWATWMCSRYRLPALG